MDLPFPQMKPHLLSTARVKTTVSFPSYEVSYEKKIVSKKLFLFLWYQISIVSGSNAKAWIESSLATSCSVFISFLCLFNFQVGSWLWFICASEAQHLTCSVTTGLSLFSKIERTLDAQIQYIRVSWLMRSVPHLLQKDVLDGGVFSVQRLLFIFGCFSIFKVCIPNRKLIQCWKRTTSPRCFWL